MEPSDCPLLLRSPVWDGPREPKTMETVLFGTIVHKGWGRAETVLLILVWDDGHLGVG